MSRLPQYVLDAATNSSVKLALSQDLAQAGPSQLHRLIVDLADEMKNKRRTENSFIKIDLPDFIAGKGYLMMSPTGQPMHVEEYRKRVEQRVLGIADQHPAGRHPCGASAHRRRSGRSGARAPPRTDQSRNPASESRYARPMVCVSTIVPASSVSPPSPPTLDAIPDYAYVVGRGFTRTTSKPTTTTRSRYVFRSVPEKCSSPSGPPGRGGPLRTTAHQFWPERGRAFLHPA
ncbi:MAG: hypothetical protein IPL29_16110 [Propionivibrio sp.]|nr:hypothetical protein [Propionivibrio sp.]